MKERKRAVIFVNGEMADPAGVRAQLRESDYLVAVDGGLRHMQALGLIPRLLIGDLDSLDTQDVQNMRDAGVEVEIYPREKDQTDLELALERIAKEGFTEIRVVAALGGRLDQTLANLYMLELPALNGLDVRLDDGREEIFIIRGRTEINGQPGDTVSLLSMDGCTRGIVTEQLRYPLRGETLCQNRSRGISNEMLAEAAIVQVQSGRLLCIHTRRGHTAGD
jgi:thiamine pyrophosphokinase